MQVDGEKLLLGSSPSFGLERNGVFPSSALFLVSVHVGKKNSIYAWHYWTNTRWGYLAFKDVTLDTQNDIDTVET